MVEDETAARDLGGGDGVGSAENLEKVEPGVVVIGMTSGPG